VALIKLILDMIGISLPGSIALLGANKAAIILAGILQIGFWKNESIIKEELGLENYQMIILFILFIPISVFFELAIEIFLKKLYKLISQNWSLSENYKSVIYIIMVYISAIFITMSGLAKEDPEKYVFNMLSNPFVIIALIIIAIISKFIPIYLRTHNVSLKKGMALILTISVILVFGLYAHSPIDSDNDSEKDAYAITVNYNGSWIGSIYDGTNRTEITGTGNPKVPFEVIKLPITIDIQKIDGDYGILTVDILRNGEKIKTGVVQAGYTSVQIDLTQYDIKK